MQDVANRCLERTSQRGGCCDGMQPGPAMGPGESFTSLVPTGSQSQDISGFRRGQTVLSAWQANRARRNQGQLSRQCPRFRFAQPGNRAGQGVKQQQPGFLLYFRQAGDFKLSQDAAMTAQS